MSLDETFGSTHNNEVCTNVAKFMGYEYFRVARNMAIKANNHLIEQT